MEEKGPARRGPFPLQALIRSAWDRVRREYAGADLCTAENHIPAMNDRQLIRPMPVLPMLFLALAGCASTPTEETMKTSSAPAQNENVKIDPAVSDTATFGAGCFWCVEAIFTELEGVLKVTPGYAGGTMPNPDYKERLLRDDGPC